MTLNLEDNSLKCAVKWISEQKIINSSKSIHKIIEEAAIQFDLDPKKTEYLLRTFSIK